MTIIRCKVPEILSMTNIIFCHFGPFLPFYPLTTQIIKMKKKRKKNPAWQYYHFTHTHYKLQLYDDSSWDIKRDGQNFLSFWTVFCPFTTTQKIKILKNWKNTWRYHHFTQVYQKSWSYAILFLRYGVCGI